MQRTGQHSRQGLSAQCLGGTVHELHVDDSLEPDASVKAKGIGVVPHVKENLGDLVVLENGLQRDMVLAAGSKGCCPHSVDVEKIDFDERLRKDLENGDGYVATEHASLEVDEESCLLLGGRRGISFITSPTCSELLMETFPAR